MTFISFSFCTPQSCVHTQISVPTISAKPLRNSGEEAEQIMQTRRVSGRQQTGQQLEGWSLVFSVGERLGFEQGCVELRGKQRFWKLPAELFDESGHIVGEGCGQTGLTTIQPSLEQTQDVVLLCTYLQHVTNPSPLKMVMMATSTIRSFRKSTSHPEGLDARKRAWLPEQAYSPSTLQEKRAGVH